MADRKVIIEAESGWSSPSIELVLEDGALFQIGDKIIRTVVSETEEELRARLTKLV